MRVLITGANGFIGKNLTVYLRERKVDVVPFTRETSPAALPDMLKDVDFVFHLAGVNRPQDPQEFVTGNTGLSEQLAEAIRAGGRAIPVAYTSSIQAEFDNPYGRSKRAAEDAIAAAAIAGGAPAYIYRLPNVFGKWAKPNYNSAVATFCHNIANGLPITINDPAAVVHLVYVDDVCKALVALLETAGTGVQRPVVEPSYRCTVGELADHIREFERSRASLTTPPVGTGLLRALYATYLSVLRPGQFSYDVPTHGDARGVFVEMLRTRDSGQFSFFTAHPGVTRGGHYHHTKNEKFLVLKGRAHFGFRHIVTGETTELVTSDEKPEIVETIPGWSHNITNIGTNDLIVMLWANEIFDRAVPDTIAHEV